MTRQVVSPFNITVWFGGDFTAVNGQPRTNIAAYDVSGNLKTFSPNINSVVNSLLVSTDAATGNATQVYVGGIFTMAGGAPRAYLASVAPDGTPSAWDPSPSGGIFTLVWDQGMIAAGGFFYCMRSGMTRRDHIAAIDATSGAVRPWNPGADGSVRELTLYGSSLYIGGSFSHIGSDDRVGIAELNLSTMALTPWNPEILCGTCLNPIVYAIARPTTGATVYIAGHFDLVNGQSRNNLAAVDTGTGATLPFNVNANSDVRCLALQEETAPPFNVIAVYAGGLFNAVNGGLFGNGPGGITRYGLVSLEPTTGQAGAWNPSQQSSRVHSVLFVEGTPAHVFVGGEFTMMGGTSAVNLAVLDAQTGLLEPWSPSAGFGTAGRVSTLMSQAGWVYVGGLFNTIDGEARLNLARINAGPTGEVSDWNPDVSDEVLDLTQYGGTVYAGGGFQVASNYAHANIAGIGDGTVTGVESAPVSVPPGMLWARPNPFAEQTSVRFSLSRAADARVAVYDVAGRLVRQLHRGRLGMGEHIIGWDGRNESGRPVAKGSYLLRVEAGDINQSTKVLLLR